MKNHFIELTIPTRDGTFLARYSENGLAELDFPKNGRAESSPGLDAQQRVPARQDEIPVKVREWHGATESALKNILAGNKPDKFPPLDATGTEFQKSVWREMKKIHIGRTKSYGEIAEAIGKPKAMRAVGGACGANPIPVLVPCHRVLAANKKLGGFSGGLDWKRKLLAREKADYAP